MDSEEFRIRGKELIDYIADYMENIKLINIKFLINFIFLILTTNLKKKI